MKTRSAGFTLVELLTVTAIISILATLLMSAMASTKRASRKVVCISNARQLGIASQLYWDDHAQRTFAYSSHRSQDGMVYWFGWLGSGQEGHRRIDHSQGALWPYFMGRGIELCPSFNYRDPQYKPKAKGASFGYGYNLHLSGGTAMAASGSGASGLIMSHLSNPAGTALFADAAQINDFQAPASREHPMVEEFYYVNQGGSYYANGHFRHDGAAMVVFCDGHVSGEMLDEETLDQRLPRMQIARLRKEILNP